MDIIFEGELDGIETATLVKNEYGIPVVFLTSMSDKAFLERAKISNPYSYVMKSFEPRELETNIEIALNKRLVNQKKQFNLISYNLDDILWIFNIDLNKFSFVSSGFDKIFGVSTNVLKGRMDKWCEFIHPSDANVLSIKSGKIVDPYEIEYRIINKHKEIKWLHEKVTLSLDSETNERILIGATKDISNEKINESLRLEKEKADLKLKVRDTILANMSHEIRTPLNAIIGVLGFLNDSERLSGQQLEYIREIKNSSDTLVSIVNDMLDLTKIETGKAKLNISVVNIGRMIEQLTNSFRPKIQAKQISLDVNIDSNVPKFIKTDEVK